MALIVGSADQINIGLGSIPEGDPAEQTAVEEASVIHLIRVLVAEAAPTADVSECAMDRKSSEHHSEQDINDVTCEEAGCLLWDMSASRPLAMVMLRNRVLEALEVVITRELQVVHALDKPNAAPQPLIITPAMTLAVADGYSSPDARNAALHQQQQQQHQRQQHQKALRLLEICIGILANLIVTQPAAASAVSGRPDLLALLLAPPRSAEDEAGPDGSDTPWPADGGVLYVDDARVLTELFRLFSLTLRCQGTAVWLALTSQATLQRVMWVGAATADTQVFARFLDMLVALLHSASGSVTAAVVGESGAVSVCGEPAAALGGTAATVVGAGDRGASCCRMLMECGLLGLLHQVLLQALRGCMPAEEKYGELGSGDAEAFGSVDDSVAQRTWASPPSVVSGVVASQNATGGVAANETGACVSVAEATPRNDGNGSCASQSTSAAASTIEADTEGPSPIQVGTACGTEVRGETTERDAAAVAAALAVAGPVPLSEEAMDAALRLIEELVGPNGPLVQNPGDDDEEGSVAAGRCSRSGAEVLIQLHEARGLRPGLLQLLLGLLRYQYDSMQVVEGLLVVLVDLGPAVQEAVAACSPDQAVAIASRLVELLQDSCYSNPTDPTTSSVVQLQQAAWYLLAAALRGSQAAVAAAVAVSPATHLTAAASPPASPAAANSLVEFNLRRKASNAVSPGTPGTTGSSSWQEVWPSLEHCLRVVPELPQSEGCRGYLRACCMAGMRLSEQLGRPSRPAAAAAATPGNDDIVKSRCKDEARLEAVLQGILDALKD